MPNPNNIYKNSERKTILAYENVHNEEPEANKEKDRLKKSGEYWKVVVTRFKVGPRPNKNNGFKQYYGYVVRGYKK